MPLTGVTDAVDARAGVLPIAATCPEPAGVVVPPLPAPPKATTLVAWTGVLPACTRFVPSWSGMISLLVPLCRTILSVVISVIR